MKDKLRTGKMRIILLLTFFVGILVLVGVLMQGKMQTLLHSHIENQITEQAGILAEVLEEKLVSELTNLENIANYIQNEKEDVQKIMEMAQQGDAEAIWGILELDRNEIYGKGLDTTDFTGVQDSFRGNKAVSYKEGYGLLFTVPVYNNGNVKYVLYKLVEEDLLTDKFGMSCYDQQGRILAANREGQIVIPYLDWNAEDEAFLKQTETQEVFSVISEKMNIASEAASYYASRHNPQYLFVAEVGDFDLLLMGTVAESVAAEGISYIITLVLWVFGLLLLLLAIGMAFLFGAEEKAKESEELRRAKIMADTANQAKTNFLANMSHEIRTPINAVMGMNEMILRECEDETIKEYAFNIQNASRTLLSLVNDILDLSKIEAGKMEIVEQNYHFSSVLNEVVNMIQVKAEEKGLRFQVEIDENIPDNLFGDEVRIRQVMVNLLNNAVKYTNKGSVRLKVESGTNIEGMVVLKMTVKDTGIGIREEDMAKLFRNFERLDQQANHAVEGTGLGLAITKKLLELMKGRMEVESVYGEGSTFTINLPQIVTEEGGIGDFGVKHSEYMQALHTYTECFRAPNARVLVVDDHEMNLFVLKNLLKKTQLQVTCCTSGDECLELVKQQTFDVILLDHMMPEMDGIETLKRMKAMEDTDCKDTPVIALTANAILGVREMYLAEGFDDYLSKPIVGEKLEEMLKRYIPVEKILPEDGGAGDEGVGDEGTGDEGVGDEGTCGRGLINISVGLQYSGNMEEMYREFLKLFCELYTEKKQSIDAYYEKVDWKNYTIQVHSLKSTSLSIGGQKLSEAAEALEKAGKEKNEMFIREHHQEAMELYDATVREGYHILKGEIHIG